MPSWIDALVEMTIASLAFAPPTVMSNCSQRPFATAPDGRLIAPYESAPATSAVVTRQSSTTFGDLVTVSFASFEVATAFCRSGRRRPL